MYYLYLTVLDNKLSMINKLLSVYKYCHNWSLWCLCWYL